MAYTALYRKYRPKTFDEVIGQEHITKTLLNQIRRGEVGHAYLFTGTRGIGKTTVARIFAQAINCLNPINGSACGKCEVCKSQSIDINEMDGASNNGVDQVREIRENVVYPPVNGKYKVYIIDEVHMLTGAAFNALLKTLEEPPEYVVFILCTTEAHKIPATVLSRCMRFDFRLVKTTVLFELLKKIFDKIDKKYESAALYLIAENAQGSVRDALSLADRCLSISDELLTYDETVSALGASSFKQINELVEAIINANVRGVLESIDILMKSGKNAAALARETASYFRNLIVVKQIPNANELLRLPDALYTPLIETSAKADTLKMLNAAENFGRLEGELRYSISQQITLEACAIKTALQNNESDYAALIERINKLEQGQPRTQIFASLTDSQIKSLWSKVIAKARDESDMLFALVSNVLKVEIQENELIVHINEVTNTMLESSKDTKERIFKLIMDEFNGIKIRLLVKIEQNESENIQRLKNITEGKLTIE
ncbi:MAG: DNA polymerase III subunit gamma/tau [Clostridia bacterium]